MGNFIQGSQLRTLLYGNQVINKAQVPPNSGATATLFTITGGLVAVTSLIGRVTTVMSGTTGAIALGVKPAAGTGTEEKSGISTAGVIGGAEVGSIITVGNTAGLAAATVVNLFAGNAVFYEDAKFIVNSGVIEVTTSVATMTGAIDWYLSYIPIDTGASVS